MAKDKGAKDDRLDWIKSKVENSFRNVQGKKVDQFISKADNVTLFQKFLNTPEEQNLFIGYRKAGLEVSLTPFEIAKAKGLVIFKKPNVAGINVENIADSLVVEEYSDALIQTNILLNSVYLPLVKNQKNVKGWPKVVSQDVRTQFDKFSAQLDMFVGHTKGETVLPIPPIEATTQKSSKKEQTLSPQTASQISPKDVDRSTIHSLESAIIDWTREIKNSIEIEPEKALNIAESRKKYHGPKFELNFWKLKTHNLQNLHQQLNTEKVAQVVQILEKTNSTYVESYKRMFEDLQTASEEATSIHKHLQPLGPYVDSLTNPDTEPANYHQCFRPVIHMISLIWESCEHYDQLKLISLFRQMCNDIIATIYNHVDPSTLWESELDDSEVRLKEAIKNCDIFMNVFNYYRSKMSEKFTDRTDRQWNFEKQTVFRRFNAFTERLHDLLDVILHVKDFLKLERVEIGGIKGEMLTVMVRQVYEEFKESQEKMQRSDYDLLDLTVPHFDNDFYQFRSAIMDYDKRLCYVIDKGFRFCPIPATAFKLLESFESQLRRDMIRNEVFEKYIQLMDLYTQDLTSVYHIFNSNKDSPPVLSNLPRVSGSIAWVNALIDRISWPYNKLKNLPEEISSHPNMKRITKKYTFLVKQMRQFEKSVYKTWVANVERISREKLDETIMKRLSDRRLSLNFDPQLTSCIQEVKYLNLFSMEVPESATAVFDRKDDFRHFTGQLEVIVRQYNTVIQTVMDVERPLIQDRMASIDELMERPLQQLNWTSADISDFIDEASTRVNDLYSRLNFLKGNVKTIKKMIENWMNLYEVITSNKEVEEQETAASMRLVKIVSFWRNMNNLFNVPAQTTTNKIFLQWREKTSTAINSPADVIEQGGRIHKIVKASLQKIEADPNNPDWRHYVEYLDQTVQHGLAKSIEHCLQYLVDTMNPVTQMSDLGKPTTKGFTILMEAKLEFLNNTAIFKPSIELDDREAVQIVVQYWLDRIFTITSKINKLSNPSENFGAISESQELLGVKDQVEDLLQITIDKMMDLRNAFTQYSHLWEEDPKDLIQSLYDQALEEEQMEAEAQEKKDGAPVGNSPQRLPLAKFDEEIQHYEQLHEEITQLPELVCFGWISIDTSPIRYAISTLAKKWRFALLDYMAQDVKQQLSTFSQFIENMKGGLSQDVPKDDYPKLVEMMSYLMDIQERPEFTNENHFEPFRETVTLLKKYDIKVPTEVIQQLEDARPLWKTLMKQFYEVKDKLSVLQNAEIKKISAYESDFIDAAEQYRKQFLNEEMFNYDVGVERAYELMDQVHLELVKRELELEDVRRKQKLFGLIQNPGTPVLSSRNDLKTLKKIWDVVAMVLWQIEDWKSIPFLKIDTDDIEDQVKKFSRSMKTIDKRAKKWNVYIDLESYVGNFQRTLPLVHDLRNEGMRDRHWQMLMNKTGVKFELSANFKLENLLELNLHKFEEDVQEIVDRADKEIKLEAQLKQFETNWVHLSFDLDTHKDVKIVRVPEEVVECLEDNQVQLQNIASMRFNDFFIDQIEEWVKKLGLVDTNMYLLLDVQKKWQYLETIFIGSEDIREQLPEESKRFDSIDTELRRILKTAAEDPNIIHFTQQTGLEEDLLLLQEKLGMCENKLTAYLEEKKKIFPRFYFTSIVDLLDILSKGGQAPHLIMKHMAKLFQAIKTLIFEKDTDGNPTNVATGLIGNRLNEILMFKTPIKLEGKVEDWLNALKEHIKETLRLYLAESIVSYEEQPRHEWLVNVNAQLVLVASQLYWTSEVLQSFEALEENNENAMKDYYAKQVDQLNHLIKAVQGDLNKKLRMKIMNLITIDVHARDIVERLISENVTNNQAFLWQSQLRQRWDENEKDCFINICDAQFRYGYEFLGNAQRLVITPLTDRIYITLTQSLHLIMGGAPAGPAGTGKTETTKDLGAQLGISTYVFNCSDQMDNKSLGDIFKGLASSGSFGCFDEFNRISVEVLSVVSTQFKSILDALKEKKTRFLFERDEIALDANVGVFITMNPGYLGRTALPESLKALFRPVTVVVPDFDLICENMLMAEGFIDAKVLSQKFITLYRLNADLLSKQSHYDWGLRAIKSVLVVAGALKRAETHIPESHILMRALRDFNLPKIVPTDLDVFMGLVHDLFPGIDLERKQDKNFESGIAKTLVKNKLQPEEGLVLKIVQLQEIMEVRHSVFIIGPAGSGKSTIWKNLADSQSAMSEKVTIKDLNPKAITSHELYGRFNEVTGDWKDGLMSTTMRDLANIEDTKPKWIILDGDLDTEWIESMNSVMDDNRILTLANNDRIPLLQHMKLIFEIAHLKYATPATVSRAGILYVDKADIGWQPYVASWIDKRPTAERAHMTIFFDRYVAETLFHIQRNFKFVLEQNAINMVETLCRLLEGLLTEENVPPGTDKEVYEMYFSFAAVWAFGGPLGVRDGVDYRKQFDKWWRMTWRNQVKFPDGATVFDFFLDSETKKFERWTNRVDKFEFDPELSLANMMVPTEETTSVKFFMDILIPMGYPILLVGNAGCGKTKLVEQQLVSLNKDEYENKTINFNYYTGAENLQMVMESNLEKKGGKRYGPPGSKKMVFFIDDLNMPLIDAYGTQTPIALLRQHMDYAHWYERTKWTLREISKVQYLCSMNPTAGSFTVNDRLQRHFVTFAINFPGDTALTTIYQQILDGHLSPFVREVNQLSDNVVKATLDLHKKVSKEFTKTASNFHYEFNLRHLSNVFSGLLQSQPSQFRKAAKFAQLWNHEVTRVYHDLLSSTKDTETFNKVLGGVTNQYFSTFVEAINESPINVFTHFANGIGEKAYDSFTKIEDLKKTLEDALEDHNRQRATMDLVLFEDAMKHVCRINRIIETGNALLVGVGGSGKQSLSRLAAFISDYDVYQITITRGYSVENLKEDLRAMYKKAGQKGEGLIFLFTDTQIVDERFLVYINDLLSSGNIPDLFAPEDVDEIVNSLRTEVKSAGIVDVSNANVWKYFIQKVRQYLHVVLCFSPVGEDLRVRARKFPALVNCTQIDWFFGWPEDALLSVADRFLREEDLGDHVDSVVQFMAFSQKTVEELSAEFKTKMKRYNYTTPKSFLEFIKLYKSLLRANLSENEQQINRLQGGIDKLESTTSQVSELEQVLVGQQKVVAEKKKETEEMLEIVGKDKAIVEEENAKAKVEEEKTEAIASSVTEKEAQCRKELEKAEPMVRAAAEALDTLDKKELTEMRSFGNPPSAVVNVMCAVIILLSTKKVPKQKELTWAAAQKAMSKGAEKFLQELKEYNKENIPDATVKAVRPYLDDPEFSPEIVKSKSNAAAGLCFWVQNIVAFHDINKKVIPLRQDQALAEKELAKAEAQLKKVKSKVKKLNDKLAGLEAEFAAKEQEKADIIAKAKKTEDSLALAQRLVKALASESVRWKQSIKSLKEDRAVIMGDVLLGSAFVSYAGGFDITFRKTLRERLIAFIKEKKIPASEDLSVVKVLTDDAKIAKWGNEGLPNDITSIENGCILTNCERWPLMIDPQLQGIAWIRGRISDNLHVVRLGTKKLVETMERAIQSGHTVLVENIGEEIDAVLSPIIKREITKRGRSKFITLDNEVEYDDNFRLIFHTKYANPHYIPEIQAETTLINFSVTMKGLEDQLLATVVSKERADLEQKRMRLIEQMNEFKIKIKELEDALLENLQNAGDDILEDIELIENLEKTKETSAEIKVKVEQGKKTEVEINEARERYREVAARGSLLYFLLDELKLIHSFYKYSLSAFETVFVRAIASAKKDDDLKQRILNLIDSITFQVYKYTCRGLFEDHKLIFVTNLCFKVHGKDLDAQELKFLMTGEKDLQPPENPFTEWLSEDCWQMVCTLNTLPAFTRLVDDMNGSSKRWAIWSMYEAPEKQKLPQDWKNKSHLQRLCIIRAIRPDRLTHAMREFVGAKMGRRYVDSIPFILDQIYAESNPSTPLFFILSPGANPVKQIEALGKKLGFSDENSKFANIALGRGQEKRAEEELDRAYKHGGWVVLQNIHLMQKWLPTLERKLEKLASGSHKDFRVYLSAEPHPISLTEVIPQSILQNSIKLTNEPPEDLKSNILRAFANFNQETLESCIKQNEFKTILFTLCFFHAIVLGRRKFGFQGWSTPYSFNMGDLTISADVLYNYLEANDDIPWEDIKYIFGEIMYGGHITDHWDRRTCSTYLDIYMNDRLFESAELGPEFPTPQPMNYDEYIEYLDKSLPDESPMMFGLHSNAEITYLSQQSEKLFDTLITLTGGVETEGEGQTKEEIVNEKIDFILPQLPEDFNMEEIYSRVDKRTPYVNVCLQECERMNLLLNIMRTSLMELQQGLSGALTISEQMDQLLNDLYRDKVPTNWALFPSLRGLGEWFQDVLKRIQQLEEWSAELQLPKVVWLSGLFNPQSFLTAIMQTAGRKTNSPLNEMVLQTEVTKKMDPTEFTSYPRDGCYIHGLSLEGAGWDLKQGVLCESKLKELRAKMPVIHVKAVPRDKVDQKNIYLCPVYVTSMRGGFNYVFTAQLKTKAVPSAGSGGAAFPLDSSSLYTMRGVCLLLT
mmetsp:Transcript_10755/g.40251  ORF Transcript_10755/g.40251 Transcript_10755/m.40251 type:complete len:4525 (-) Transcript_10755:51-13625(-)